ncbi:MAG: AAA family ATPase [Pseudonocardia sp.]
MTYGDAALITDERAADLRYCEALRRQRQQRLPVAHGRFRQAPGPKPAPAPVYGLLGRVALIEPTDIADGTDFYIGSHYHDGDGIVVFSWAAPIASTFFQSWTQHELCSRVTSRRTLLRRRGGEITDYVDDAGPARTRTEPFARRELAIPKAPVRRQLPGRSREQPPIPEQRSALDDHTDATVSSEQVSEALTAAPDREPMRAERAVLAAISAPRQERLTSVLATLQPDQYEMVTAASDRSLVIEGRPGTGKTVVAAHRAAYLVHPAHEPHPLRRVLVVGPTEHYVQHIRGVLAELDGGAGTVDAMSLESAMLDVRGISASLDNTHPTDPREVHDELYDLADRAVRLLREQGQLIEPISHAASVEKTYEALRANRVDRTHLTQDFGRANFLRALPAFTAAQTMRRCLPILAACGGAVAGVGPYSYDHVVVDEAQDLSPLEWAVLRFLNPSSRWTLLGDLNQRRSDLSHPDWTAVSRSLAVDDMPVKALRRGYRTSAAIMEYASRLLPEAERSVVSLQPGGEPPKVRRIAADQLYEQVAHEVSTLLDRHPDGTVAVIGVHPPETIRALRGVGFQRDPQRPNSMINDVRHVRVLTPQEARGLEFDAAIVVEPIMFPKPVGRNGLLYTSLTRANRELVVLHTGQIQRELRTPEPVAKAAVLRQNPAPKRAASPDGTRFLIVGPEDWIDQVAGLDMLRFATEKYGNPSDLEFFTVDGSRGSWQKELDSLQPILRDASSTNVLLVSDGGGQTIGIRSILDTAKNAGAPIWCWSPKLGMPIRAEHREFVNFWWALIHKDLARTLIADADIRLLGRALPLMKFVDAMEDYNTAAKVPTYVRGSTPLRDLLGSRYHRRRVNRIVFQRVWTRVNAGRHSTVGAKVSATTRRRSR